MQRIYFSTFVLDAVFSDGIVQVHSAFNLLYVCIVDDYMGTVAGWFRHLCWLCFYELFGRLSRLLLDVLEPVQDRLVLYRDGCITVTHWEAIEDRFGNMIKWFGLDLGWL